MTGSLSDLDPHQSGLSPALVWFETASDPAIALRWERLARICRKADGCEVSHLFGEPDGSRRWLYSVWDSSTQWEAIWRAAADDLRAGESSLWTLCHHLGERLAFVQMQPSQILTLRHYRLRPGSGPRFEALWLESANAELEHLPGCLFKRLHEDKQDPARLFSLSAWRATADADEASHNHLGWQRSHEPYPLAEPVVRQTLVLLRSSAFPLESTP